MLDKIARLCYTIIKVREELTKRKRKEEKKMIKNLTILALNDDDTEYKVAEKWWERINTEWIENDDEFIVDNRSANVP